ncbi:winged helix-turn-helix transcriptional regulator [Flexivirga alba]|uniref:Winged helix-turn-helix transcriptional regulator n=1 Tax=Flexivirga alba TaxID=702742 RepID=A0ABW2ACD6_9MICO
MKSYDQFCAVARALDVVGDRWVLLIVRELLAFGPSRYTDLKRGLPGIATNLLADRLKAMEAEGLIERREAPAPVGAPVYELTDRGRALDDVLNSLARWGLPKMLGGPSATDAVQPQWVGLIADPALRDRLAPGQQLVFGIRTEEGSVRVTLNKDGCSMERGLDGAVDVTLTGPAQLVGGALSGLVTLAEAQRLGLEIDGDTTLLTELTDAAGASEGDHA